MLLRRLWNTGSLGGRRAVSYVQGQSPAPKVREYFYYIDHEGMLFLDDARIKNFTSCFKEKQFLEFFFKRLKLNDTERYRDEFPFLSVCGRERNYIRCDDLPIVFTHIVRDGEGKERLAYAHASDKLSVEWQPDRICMFPASGRVYHPAPERYGSIGLVRSKLAIELSNGFTFCNGEDHPPTHFLWSSTNHELDQKWWQNTYIGRREQPEANVQC
ncbi:UPF0598 protein C8orf82 [Anopheles darlingi]|uniref:UPF0598 protein C8orf82 n=1 Tax=Anopheles darlingi TaxID=43151 RepID=W5JNU2_ANODA|nr:UPF0598 protein C8orf82 [Anopheles darlingi]